ncbi:cytosine permease [Nocardioides sp. B-3]|nr:cytosine permease [Nocardioides sp. B-3]UUZ60879.1 cytosine permease [Nocardioides sp. B-3]
MTTTSESTVAVRGVERRTIDVIPPEERHGTPFSQFTLWMGANLQITAIVDGALAVVFGADALWAIIGLFLGNLLGGIVMALHSAQGPRLGLPQMISSRAQFGIFGAIVPLVLVIVMYLGFTATGTVLAGRAINELLRVDNATIGIVLFVAIVAVIAIVGYRWIHAVGRFASVLGVLGLAYLAVQLVRQHDVSAAFAGNQFDVVTFLLAVSLAAGWQLTYGPYVADYSRYLPAETSQRSVFWWTYGGSVLGSQLSMTFGAIVAAVAGDAFLTNRVGWLGGLASGAIVAGLIYALIVIGKLTVTCLNAYGSFMCAATITTALTGRRTMGSNARRLRAAHARGLDGHRPVGQRRLPEQLQELRAPAADGLHSPVGDQPHRLLPGVQGAGRPAGALRPQRPLRPVERRGADDVLRRRADPVPFPAQKLYTGPVTKALGGADISRIVGLVVPAVMYYVWASRNPLAPAAEVEVPFSDVPRDQPRLGAS